MVPWSQKQLQCGLRHVSPPWHGTLIDPTTETDSVSTLRSAIELKAVFDRLQQAEQSGLPPEALRKLEEQAAEQGMRTLWKVSSEADFA